MKWGLVVSPYLGFSPDIIQALHGARDFPLKHGKKGQHYAALINVPQAGASRHIAFQLKHETGDSGLEELNAHIFPLLIPTYRADLSKVSNSYDKFRQTVGGE